jgi:RNA polymerase sigma-70 factor (ECF subfamily)
LDELTLIAGCQKQDRLAQQELYRRFSARLFGVCRRYLGSGPDAEDALVKGMYKILTHIGSYEGKGNFMGWMTKVVVNECLMILRANLRFQNQVEVREDDAEVGWAPDDVLSAQQIRELVDSLPTGYRTVFNLYVIEGFKHREIAEMLGISENTSKSQLLLAKGKLREMLDKNAYHEAI